jgi:hypothetical protein
VDEVHHTAARPGRPEKGRIGFEAGGCREARKKFNHKAHEEVRRTSIAISAGRTHKLNNSHRRRTFDIFTFFFVRFVFFVFKCLALFRAPRRHMGRRPPCRRAALVEGGGLRPPYGIHSGRNM